MKWRWWHREPNGAARAAAEELAKLRRAQRATAHVERMAEVFADLPAEELADRLRAAMTLRWPTT